MGRLAVIFTMRSFYVHGKNTITSRSNNILIT